MLNDLPNALYETYSRTLLDLDEEKREYARRLFRCLKVSIRPLHLEELAEILAIRLDKADLPTFNEAGHPENVEEAVISACSSLIGIVDSEGSKVVKFWHFSVEQFLTSERLATAEYRLSYYHILPEPAHTLLAHACLNVLLQLDGKFDRDNTIARFPFALYAARYWVDHAQFGNTSFHLREVMERLFNPTKSHFAAWIRLYNIDCQWTDPMSKTYPTRLEAEPLYYAALSGFGGLVEHLIAVHLQNVNSRGGFHSTPLHAALIKGHSEVATLLVKNGADPNSSDNCGRTPLHIEIARLLESSRANAETTNDESRTPLHLAPRQDNVGVAQLLVEWGADVTARDKDEWNPLHLALSGGHVELVRILIQHGTGGITQDKDKWTSLHRIQLREYIGVAQTLFDHGADITAQDRRGLISLHLASGGQVKLALILLQHSTDAAAQNWIGWTGEHVELTRILLERGGDVDARDNDNCTPLHWASEQAHPEVVRSLLKRGADAGARDNDNSTPLHCASQQGHLEVVRVLVKHGVEVNVRDHTNWTPLHGASLYGHQEVVQFLLEHGADPRASDQGGWTSLQWPSYNGDLKLFGCSSSTARMRIPGIIITGPPCMARRSRDIEKLFKFSSSMAQMQIPAMIPTRHRCIWLRERDILRL